MTFPTTVSIIKLEMPVITQLTIHTQPMITKPMITKPMRTLFTDGMRTLATRPMISTRFLINSYTTDSIQTNQLLSGFFHKISGTSVQDPHPWLRIASHNYSEPLRSIKEVDLHTLSIMDLLNQFGYPSISGYTKCGILITIRLSYGEDITFSIGKAIPLTDNCGNQVQAHLVYSMIYKLFLLYSEKYEGATIVRVMIRLYMENEKKTVMPSLSDDDRYNLLYSILQAGFHNSEAITARGISHSKRKHTRHITAIKECQTNLQPFIVSDIETILENNIHRPYSAGLLIVRPGKHLKDDMIETYYSEDYSLLVKNIEDKGTKVLYDLVLRISAIVKKDHSIKTVFFHNFSRFDGIIVLKHLACHHPQYKLKPLMRNNRLYELSVYSGKKMLFRFRDSLNLLPGALRDLAKSLCPALGPKGSLNYNEVSESNLLINKQIYLDYMKQDILLLGGVMQKAQEIYWNLYNVDIGTKITLSSLALTIFRMKYYDDQLFPIHIPNQNEDQFIRKGYYGGHTDVYKPFGTDLYYYDVNSLYPFVMKEYPMPCGVPVWYGNLEDKDLDNVLGFIEAYVVCPKTIKKPFLPYRNDKGTLIFPT